MFEAEIQAIRKESDHIIAILAANLRIKTIIEKYYPVKRQRICNKRDVCTL